MPLNGSVGESINTPLKQEDFALIINTQFGAIKHMLRRSTNSWMLETVLGIDLNGGHGWSEQWQCCGSPALAVQAARDKGIPLHLYVTEQDKDTYPQLCETMQARLAMNGSLAAQGHMRLGSWQPPILCELFCDTYRWRMPRLLAFFRDYIQERKRQEPTRGGRAWTPGIMGYCYSDENGSMPPVDVLQSCAKHLPSTDIIIHVSATNVKRRKNSPKDPWPYSLSECVQLIGKRNWIVREPFLKHQWSFLIGTQWEAFPVFSHHGFHPIESPAGQRIMRLLNEVAAKEGR